MDIVKRLRRCLRFDKPTEFESELEAAAREAALEIERLESAAKEALALLDRVPSSPFDDVPIETVRHNLRAALQLE